MLTGQLLRMSPGGVRAHDGRGLIAADLQPCTDAGNISVLGSLAQLIVRFGLYSPVDCFASAVAQSHPRRRDAPGPWAATGLDETATGQCRGRPRAQTGVCFEPIGKDSVSECPQAMRGGAGGAPFCPPPTLLGLPAVQWQTFNLFRWLDYSWCQNGGVGAAHIFLSMRTEDWRLFGILGLEIRRRRNSIDRRASAVGV